MSIRRSLDETREKILDAGVAMMSEAGFSMDTANISLIDACRRAGLSTAGSGYKIWDTQAEFRKELVRHALALEGDRSEPGGRVVEVVEKLGPESGLDDVIRVAANENVESIVGTEWFTRLIALWLAASGDEELCAVQRDTQHQLLSSLADTFSVLLAGYGREMRPPFTVAHLTQAIAAQMNGLGYFLAYADESDAHTIMRPTGPDGEEQRWHLMGCAAQALIEAFTRPVE